MRWFLCFRSLHLGALQCSLLSEGSRFPLSMPSSFPFNCFLSLAVFISRQLRMKCLGLLQWVTVLLLCLGIFHCPCQLDHEFFCHPLDSTRIITLWILTIISILFSSCAKQMAGFLESGWLPLSFLRGKKLVVLSLDGPLAAWILELHDSSIESSFLASLVALR